MFTVVGVIDQMLFCMMHSKYMDVWGYVMRQTLLFVLLSNGNQTDVNTAKITSKV